MVLVDIVISRSYPNDTRANVCFPIVFRPRAQKSRGNINFPIFVNIEIVHKQRFPEKLFPRVPRPNGRQRGTARAYFKICRRGGWHRTGLGLPCIMYFVEVFLYFSLSVYVLG